VTVHVAGAGMAGLAAALTAARAGHRVAVHEAAATAGGRCRSFFDSTLGRSVDNGTHVVLGANRAIRDFLTSAGGGGVLGPATGGAVPFLDLSTGAGWSVDCRRGAVGAVLGCGGLPAIAMVLGKLLAPGTDATVAQAYGGLGPLHEHLIAPLATAVLNRSVEHAPAAQLAPVLRSLAFAGRGALAPYVAPRGLSPDWIDPVLRALEAFGAVVSFHDPLTDIEIENGGLRSAQFRSGAVHFGQGDALILAVPPWGFGSLSPHIAVPRYETSAIICTHFLVSPAPRLPGGAALMGVTGATAEWLALRGDILSVTVSAAERLLDMDAPYIAGLLWRDAAAVLSMDDRPLPPHRVIKERRATARVGGGVGPQTGLSGLLIVGGWCDGAAPDTLEAAARSGIKAAVCLGSPV
jgi:hypothetical protein